MITTSCHLCHKTITLETNPIPKENINPNNGFTICNKCYNNNFSIEVIRDKKLTELLDNKNRLTLKKLFKLK